MVSRHPKCKHVRVYTKIQKKYIATCFFFRYDGVSSSGSMDAGRCEEKVRVPSLVSMYVRVHILWSLAITFPRNGKRKISLFPFAARVPFSNWFSSLAGVWNTGLLPCINALFIWNAGESGCSIALKNNEARCNLYLNVARSSGRRASRNVWFSALTHLW